MVAKKLYVGNLNYNATEEELRRLAEQFGHVLSVIIPHDKATGAGRGFGFVTFAAEDDAGRALAELNGTEFLGRSLKVAEATAQGPAPRRWQP